MTAAEPRGADLGPVAHERRSVIGRYVDACACGQMRERILKWARA